ncbi:MAG: GNAT family N-acetyltransferase [Chloroflexi bacterium]|nr:GNAT family N-acetyltransferase [Chloroflexota bacterium]
MNPIKIRPFRYTDLDAIIQIAEHSFAAEYTAQGMTPANFARQIRSVTRGRMIPFKLLTALMGIRWNMFVAEVDNNIVGCGGYLGQRRIELANLMVEPDYRRRGIGQRLLQERLHHLKEQGCPLVITTVLATNEASLGNLGKQNFEIFDRYTLFETSLPLQSDNSVSNRKMIHRPVKRSDKLIFTQLEATIMPPIFLAIQGSAISNYSPSLGTQLMNRLSNSQQWIRAFELEGTVAGFLLAQTANNQNKGVLGRPLLSDDNLSSLPIMLHTAASWLTQLGKTSIQISVPHERKQLAEQLKDDGWNKTQSWIRLLKRLDGDIPVIE